MGVMKNIATARGAVYRGLLRGETVQTTIGDGFSVNLLPIGFPDVVAMFEAAPLKLKRRALRVGLRDALKAVKATAVSLAPRPYDRRGKKLKGKKLREALRPGQTKHLFQSLKVRKWKARGGPNVIKFALQTGRRDELGIPWPKFKGYYPVHLELGYWYGNKHRPRIGRREGRFYLKTAFRVNQPKMQDIIALAVRRELARRDVPMGES